MQRKKARAVGAEIKGLKRAVRRKKSAGCDRELAGTSGRQIRATEKPFQNTGKKKGQAISGGGWQYGAGKPTAAAAGKTKGKNPPVIV